MQNQFYVQYNYTHVGTFDFVMAYPCLKNTEPVLSIVLLPHRSWEINLVSYKGNRHLQNRLFISDGQLFTNVGCKRVVIFVAAAHTTLAKVHIIFTFVIFFLCGSGGLQKNYLWATGLPPLLYIITKYTRQTLFMSQILRIKIFGYCGVVMHRKFQYKFYSSSFNRDRKSST